MANKGNVHTIENLTPTEDLKKNNDITAGTQSTNATTNTTSQSEKLTPGTLLPYKMRKNHDHFTHGFQYCMKFDLHARHIGTLRNEMVLDPMVIRCGIVKLSDKANGSQTVELKREVAYDIMKK